MAMEVARCLSDMSDMQDESREKNKNKKNSLAVKKKILTQPYPIVIGIDNILTPVQILNWDVKVAVQGSNYCIFVTKPTD